jgi:lactate permease
MLWAVYTQNLDPVGNRLLSTLFAALPVVTLFWLLVPRRWLAPKAGAGGALVALLVAITVYGMPAPMAVMSFVHGAGFGLLPVGWTIFNAMLIYNITVETGQFTIVRRSVSGLSGDARIQAILIGFAFGAFLEGAAGGGTPVAICGAIMVGLGFDPFLAAVLCLIANTSPVAYGGLGTPLITLRGVTELPTETLSVMAGHQLPILSVIVPLYMVKIMCSWKQTLEVWPALLVAGGSFAVFQYTFATFHAHVPGVVLFPMTDIGGGIFSLVATAIFLQFWKPAHEWHFHVQKKHELGCETGDAERGTRSSNDAASGPDSRAPNSELPVPSSHHESVPWAPANIALAWAPYAIMSVLLMLSGVLKQMEAKAPEKSLAVGPLRSAYLIPIPFLNQQSVRDPELNENPGQEQKPEDAYFKLDWLSTPGTAVFLASICSFALLRVNGRQLRNVIRRTIFQMQIPIPTIACMLGLSYVTRYAGMDATLGYAFSGTGVLYPFFAPILGWLGVFLTGTDAGSNALFGSLQKITATKVHAMGVFPCRSTRAQILMCTSNSTGGVMGKMIDAQSICVATAATHQIGREADIFKAVVWHSIILAAVVGLLTLLQAYVYPFTGMVPGLPGK